MSWLRQARGGNAAQDVPASRGEARVAEQPDLFSTLTLFNEVGYLKGSPGEPRGLLVRSRSQARPVSPPLGGQLPWRRPASPTG